MLYLVISAGEAPGGYFCLAILVKLMQVSGSGGATARPSTFSGAAISVEEEIVGPHLGCSLAKEVDVILLERDTHFFQDW